MAQGKKHEPTKQERELVCRMALLGVPQEDVASVVGISVPTLEKHYRDELDNSLLRANGEVATALYQKAIRGNVTAMIFWLKTRARWRETSDVDVKGELKLPAIDWNIVPKSDS